MYCRLRQTQYRHAASSKRAPHVKLDKVNEWKGKTIAENEIDVQEMLCPTRALLVETCQCIASCRRHCSLDNSRSMCSIDSEEELLAEDLEMKDRKCSQS